MVEGTGVPSAWGVATFESDAFSPLAGAGCAAGADDSGESVASCVSWPEGLASSLTVPGSRSRRKSSGLTLRLTMRVDCWPDLVLPDFRRARSAALFAGAISITVWLEWPKWWTSRAKRSVSAGCSCFRGLEDFEDFEVLKRNNVQQVLQSWKGED